MTLNRLLNEYKSAYLQIWRVMRSVPILGALNTVPDHTRAFVLYEYELPSATRAATGNCHVGSRLLAGPRQLLLG